MKKRIQRVSPLSFGIFSAVAYGVLGLIMGLILLVLSAFDSHPSPFHGILCIVFPIGYAIAGFIFAALCAILYNLIAKITGGVEITLTDPPAGNSEQK